MKKIKNFIQSSHGKIATGLVAASVSVPVFAETPDIATTISTSLQAISSDVLATMASVAPVAIGIFGAVFCWRKGVQFFKGVAK